MNAPRPVWIGHALRGANRTVIRNMVLAAIATAGLVWLFSAGVAHGAPRIITCDQRGCSDWQKPAPSRAATRAVSVDASGNRIVIGGRPAGCPHRYCGCGLRKYLGIDDVSLNLAWNWARKYRRVAAAPGMAAVRRGHVMLLVRHVAGTRYIVRDYNGGRGLSYIHERDVRGFVFVDPSSRTASLQ